MSYGPDALEILVTQNHAIGSGRSREFKWVIVESGKAGAPLKSDRASSDASARRDAQAAMERLIAESFITADPAYEGFRFEHTRPDANSPGGKLKTHLLVVARSLEEAENLSGEKLPVHGLRPISSGPKDLEAARSLHVRDGEARLL